MVWHVRHKREQRFLSIAKIPLVCFEQFVQPPQIVQPIGDMKCCFMRCASR